ncbi:hypothetical protein [Catenuloplanes atrovinosus]|uniref:Uncharacterized protein n=1 Tax=Catenuloplanes atrovinosus TaxID=137266 RepID=A0AAE3YR96_9ACTN|nr:hypothetical protein [Catenuloplanes atrovinosus]MDR7276306.1 hypothetical protein [Catenuloplanes atrovinosus]
MSMGAPDPRPPNNDDQIFLAALSHLWSLVETRRSQRLQLVNYYLVIAAFVTAGYITAVGGGLTVVAVAVGASGMLIGCAFWYADRAYKVFMDAAIGPTVELEARLAERLEVPSLAVTAEILRKRGKAEAPSVLVSIMYLFAAMSFGLACIYAAISLR